MKGTKTLRNFATLSHILGVLSLLVGLISGMIVVGDETVLGLVLILGGIVCFAALCLSASQAEVIGNLADFIGNNHPDGKANEMPRNPVENDNTIQQTTDKKTYPPVSGELRNGIKFNIAEDGLTVTYSDGKSGVLKTNIAGVYSVLHQGRTYEYQNPQDAAEALHFILSSNAK